MMTKRPETREELKSQMAELTRRHDVILLAMNELETSQAAALDDVEPGKLLEIARKQADVQIQIQTHQAALDSLERRFNALASKAAELDRRWCREQLAERQPELDKRAARIVEVLSTLEEQLSEYHVAAEAIMAEVVLTPRVTFSHEFADSIRNRREWALKELGQS